MSWARLDRQLGASLGAPAAQGVIRTVISIMLIIDLADLLADAAGSR